MHHDVYKVYRYPLIRTEAIDTYGLFSSLVATLVSYRLGDGLHLCGRPTLANDKIVGDSAIYMPEVHDADVFTFLVFNGGNDDLKQRFC